MEFLAVAPTSLAQFLGGSECSDAIDNDTDGFTDLADAGCLADLLRDDETGELVVNSTLDKVDVDPGDGLCETEVSGECTLRAAIMEANATPGGQGVQVPAGAFELTLAPVGASPEAADGDLDIADDLVLIGAGAENTRIGGASWQSLFSDRVFEILPATQVTISGVTAQYGYASRDVCCGGSGDFNGGGIFNAGTLALTNTSVSGNWAEAGGGIYAVASLTVTNSILSGNYSLYNGGGIQIAGGTLTLIDSTVSDNVTAAYYSDGGGGISNSFGTAALANSTVSGNSAWYSSGGGILNDGITTVTNSTVSGNEAFSWGGGIINWGGLSLANSTVTGNTAHGYGGGIDNFHYGDPPYPEIENSIVADNGARTNCHGGVISLGYNLTDDTSCDFSAAGDLVVADPMLGPLVDNGGPTETHDLLPGSPAIDAGSRGCPPPTTDQRGVARPQGATCDIGAVEYVPEPGRWLMLAAGVGALLLMRRVSCRA